MSDWAWRILWMAILGGGLVGMAGLLLVIGAGSVRELRLTLEELRHGTGDDEAGDEAGAGDEIRPSE